MILFKECEVYAPEKLGKKDVLLAGQKIIAVQNKITIPAELGKTLDVEVIPADGLRMIPGLIDGHVHIAGAGGEVGHVLQSVGAVIIDVVKESRVGQTVLRNQLDVAVVIILVVFGGRRFKTLE